MTTIVEACLLCVPGDCCHGTALTSCDAAGVPHPGADSDHEGQDLLAAILQAGTRLADTQQGTQITHTAAEVAAERPAKGADPDRLPVREGAEMRGVSLFHPHSLVYTVSTGQEVSPFISLPSLWSASRHEL